MSMLSLSATHRLMRLGQGTALANLRTIMDEDAAAIAALSEATKPAVTPPPAKDMIA